MAIPCFRLRSLTAREMISALEQDGFSLVRVTGSHHRFSHPDGRRVTVSFHHPGEAFKPQTLKSMIERQAKWKDADLKRLRILK